MYELGGSTALAGLAEQTIITVRVIGRFISMPSQEWVKLRPQAIRNQFASQVRYILVVGLFRYSAMQAQGGYVQHTVLWIT